jgi:hypothetical protein
MQTGSSFKGIPLRHRDKDLPGVTILDASKPRKQKISGVDDGHFDVSGIPETSKFHGKTRFDVLLKAAIVWCGPGYFLLKMTSTPNPTAGMRLPFGRPDRRGQSR